MTRKYNVRGWIPDKPDSRDLLYAVHPLTEVPDSLNLRSRWKTPPLDQLALGRCGPMSVKSETLYDQEQDPLPDIEPCSLYHYFNTRLLMGTVNSDSGVQIRTMFKALAQYGWCPVAYHTEDIRRFRERPSAAAYAEGAKRKLSLYERIPQTQAAMEGAIAQNDPFSIGFYVYENLDEAQATGDIPMPRGRIVGGHAVVVCGYDRGAGKFDIRNSWGEGWGNGGYGRFDYEYLLNPRFASDFWTGHFGAPGPSPPPPPSPIDWQKVIAMLMEALVMAKEFCPLWLGGLRADVAVMIGAAPPEWQGLLKTISTMLDVWCPATPATNTAATLNLSAGNPQTRPLNEWEAFKQSMASFA